MMKWVFGIMIILSVVFGIGTGNIASVSNAALTEGVNAVEFFLYIVGGMCVWGGIMRIADKSGITIFLCRAFKPIGKRLFKGLDMNGKAFKAISMNIIANLLGLGNAATPLGIAAIKQLEIEDNTTDTASNNMIIFVVLNTASITLIPATVASLRLKHGALIPMDILPGVLITSVVSVAVGLISAKIINNIKRKK